MYGTVQGNPTGMFGTRQGNPMTGTTPVMNFSPYRQSGSGNLSSLWNTFTSRMGSMQQPSTAIHLPNVNARSVYSGTPQFGSQFNPGTQPTGGAQPPRSTTGTDRGFGGYNYGNAGIGNQYDDLIRQMTASARTNQDLQGTQMNAQMRQAQEQAYQQAMRGQAGIQAQLGRNQLQDQRSLWQMLMNLLG